MNAIAYMHVYTRRETRTALCAALTMLQSYVDDCLEQRRGVRRRVRGRARKKRQVRKGRKEGYGKMEDGMREGRSHKNLQGTVQAKHTSIVRLPEHDVER